MSGWVKLHRSLIDWEWYDDINATRLLIHLLLSVNYEDKRWKGQVIKAGTIACSWETLAQGCGLTKQQVRTAMTKLENSQEVTRRTHNKYQLVSLVKWEKMQDKEQADNRQANTQITGKQQADNRQITPTKEKKNIRSKEEDYSQTREGISDQENLYATLPLNQLAEDLKTSGSVKDNRMMSIYRATNHRITPQQHDQYVDQFINQLQGEGISHKDRQDANRHFFNWMLKKAGKDVKDQPIKLTKSKYRAL